MSTAVAFEVHRAAGGTRLERCFIMVMTTLIFWSMIAVQQAQMMWTDRTLFSPREHADVLRFLFRGSGGGLHSLLPRYLDYFRRDFHPFAPGDKERIEQWRAALAFTAPEPAPELPASSSPA